MPATMEELGLHLWSAEARRALALELMDSILETEDALTDVEYEERENRMIDERLAEADANPDTRRPWREVIADLRARQS